MLFIISFSSLIAEELYKFRRMGKIWTESPVLDNGYKFNFFSWDGAFLDNKGNFRDGLGRGIREADPNVNLVNLNVLNLFEDRTGEAKFWDRPRRVERRLVGGADLLKFAMLQASLSFFKLLNLGMLCDSLKKGSFIRRLLVK